MAEDAQKIAADRIRRAVTDLNLAIQAAAEIGVSAKIESIDSHGLGQQPYKLFTARTFAEIG